MPPIIDYINIIDGPYNGFSHLFNRALFEYPSETETSCSPTKILLQRGVYQFEVWGGQGGNATILSSDQPAVNKTEGGKGGYSIGTLYVSAPTYFFIYVGSKGYTLTKRYVNGSDVFGGGGGVTIHLKNSSHGTSGGGASDIRVSIDSLFSRIIVAAGGGGGSGGWEHIMRPGGSGGGVIGSTGYYDGELQEKEWRADGATQDGPGNYSESYYQTGTFGTFGCGGKTQNIENGFNYGGGGGGGWYGGNGGGHRVPGGGGSGFVFNDTKHVPDEYLLNSSYILRDTATINGNYSFPSPSLLYPLKNETGHRGNGAVKITLIYSFDIKSCNNFVFKAFSFRPFIAISLLNSYN